MSAAKVTLPIAPVRTGGMWIYDFLFFTDQTLSVGEDWTGRRAVVAFVPRAVVLRAKAFKLTSEGGGLEILANGVGIRLGKAGTQDLLPATYDWELSWLDDADEPTRVLVGSVSIEQGLDLVVAGEAPTAPIALSGGAGQVVKAFVAAGVVQVVQGAGVTGDSAYMAAVKVEGFEGSEADYLASLRAPAVDAAEEANAARDAANTAATGADAAKDQALAVAEDTATFLAASQVAFSDAIDASDEATQAALVAAQQVEDALVGRSRKAIPTAAYTVTDADRGMVLVSTFTSTVLITIPPGLGGGWYAFFDKEAVGNLYFLTGAGVTLSAAGGNTGINVLHAVAHLVQNGANAYNLVGGTTSSGPPGQIQLSAAIVAEDAAVGTVIGTLSVSGSNVGDFDFSLVDDGFGLLGTVDAHGFHLATVTELDFEAHPTLPITVRGVSTLDGTEVQRGFTVTVTNVTELTDFALSNSSLVEASPAGTLIGNLTSTPSGGSFVLLDGAGGKASLDGAALEAGATPTDYETSTGFSVQIRCDRLGESITKTLPITVLDKPELTNIALSAATMVEGSAQGTVIGDFTTTPPGGTVTLLDTAGGRFQAVASQLQAGSIATDFETQTSWQVQAHAVLGDTTFDKWFTITIGNRNEAPTNILLSASTIASGAPEGTAIGTLMGVDPDAGDTLTFSLVNSGGGVAKVAGTNGSLLQVGATATNADVATSTDITVRTTDANGLYFDKTFSMSVVAALPAPGGQDLVDAGVILMGFFHDRIVVGFSGNSVRLKRLSDNAQQDFGPTLTGYIDLAAITAWDPAGNIDVVKYYCQKLSGKELLAVGTVSFMRAGVCKRFGTTLSAINGQLTRSATDGAIGADLGDDVGCFQLVGSGIVQSSGVEFHLLCSFNERKLSTTAAATDPFGGNGVQENVFSFGSRSNVYAQHYIGTTFQSALKYSTVAGASATYTSEPNSGSTVIKQYAQQLYSYLLNGTTLRLYADGWRYQDTTFNATHAANMAAGALNNADIVIGNLFNSTANNSLRTSLRANMLFGGLLVTKPLTDRQRYFLRSKQALCGQQHRLTSLPDLKAMFDEIVLMRKVNPATGLVAGENGKLALQFNISTVTEGTPNFNFAYDIPDIGLRGIYSPSDTNPANAYKATSAYFAGVTTGTVITLAHMDATGNSPGYASNLSANLIQGTGNQFGSQNADWSFGMGVDHQAYTFTALTAGARDIDGQMGTRHKADGTLYGSLDYDQANQPQGKYNRNTSHTTFVDGETVAGYVWARATWMNTDPGQPYLLDAPVVRPTADNLTHGWKRDCLVMQAVTFEAPVGYDRSAAYATRKPMRLQSLNKSYVCVGDKPVGHADGSIAINPYGGVVDSAANATLMSHYFQYGWKGTRVADFFAPSGVALSLAQVERLHLNYFKFEEPFGA